MILDARRHGFVLLMTTEHGRWPTINGNGGREHHNVSYAVLAGGSTHGGAVIGSINQTGNIASDVVDGKRLMKTVLQACGVEQPNRADLIVGAVN